VSWTARSKRLTPVLSMALSIGQLLSGGGVTAADDGVPDLCLAIAPGVLPDGAWEKIVAAVEHSAWERPVLFPRPAFASAAAVVGTSSQVARLEVTADAGDLEGGRETADCLDSAAQWTVRVSRAFLDEGADRMLAVAPTTPGIESSVEVEWYPDQARVVTMLHFAGPMDIPNGRCWIEDVLSVGAAAGVAVSRVGRGLETSPFAEGACGRFFDYLVDGGAGQQALGLVPSSVALAEGATIVLVAEDVRVDPVTIGISGRIEFR